MLSSHSHAWTLFWGQTLGLEGLQLPATTACHTAQPCLGNRIYKRVSLKSSQMFFGKEAKRNTRFEHGRFKASVLVSKVSPGAVWMGALRGLSGFGSAPNHRTEWWEDGGVPGHGTHPLYLTLDVLFSDGKWNVDPLSFPPYGIVLPTVNLNLSHKRNLCVQIKNIKLHSRGN